MKTEEIESQERTIKLKGYERVMGESAVIRLGGIDGIRNGPTTRVGMILTKSMLFSSANFQAAFSARVLETKYI